MYHFKLFLTLSLLSPLAQALEFRQDFGYYVADKIWFGEDLMEFSDLDSNTDKGTVTTSYTRSTFGYSVSEKTSVSVFLEAASTKMNDFSAGGARAGDEQSGLSKVGFEIMSNLYATQKWSWDLEYGLTAPGSPYNPYQFNALGDGITNYHVAANVSYAAASAVGFYAAVGYVHRPGYSELLEGGQKFSLSNPDRITIDVGVPYYFRRSVFSANLSHTQSLSGIDIGPTDSDWVAFFGGVMQPPFPANRENVTAAQLNWAYSFDTFLLDVGVSRQIAGRNTDQGWGLNIGYSRSL